MFADFQNKRPDAPNKCTDAGEPDGTSLVHHVNPNTKL